MGSLLLWIGLDRWQVGAGARFEPLEAPLIAVYLVLLLGSAYLASRASRPRLDFRRTLFVVLGLVPPLLVAGFAIVARFGGRASARPAWALVCLYALLYWMRALKSLSGAWQARSTVAVLMLLGVFSTGYRAADLMPSVWAPAVAETPLDQDLAPADAESLLFDQREMIDAEVDGLADNLGPEPAVFFVGFAGVADQRVFAQEIQLAAEVVGRRFDAADRELLLINDRRDLDTHPLATLSGLEYALRAVAEKMDPERDILFLALSSHGSSEPLLEVSNGGLPLAQISAEDLAAALRDSGIKRRIVVISACYAGGFIQRLENPDTIVLAAAAPDRTSFGCSDDRDLTYFGEAFYRDALPVSTTLAEAFERAGAAIAARERAEHQTPSEPQAYFGAGLRAILKTLPMHAGARNAVTARALPPAPPRAEAP